MISIKKLLYWIVVVDLFLIAFSLNKGINWLISSQTAFISSLLVTLASFYAYKQLVHKKIESGDIPEEDRDELDIIEDKHELYDEVHTENVTEDLKAVIKEERAKIGGIKNSAQNIAKSFSAIFSPLRVVAYIVLVLGFLYINRHGYLEIWAYVSGLMVVPLVSLVAGRQGLKG
jgi:hypothetical protein